MFESVGKYLQGKKLRLGTQEDVGALLSYHIKKIAEICKNQKNQVYLHRISNI